jgi:hypothetical protein
MTKNIIDDNETTSDQARQLLESLIVKGFAGNVDASALALGEPAADIEEYLHEENEIGEDLLMKIRGIAMNREIEIE